MKTARINRFRAQSKVKHKIMLTEFATAVEKLARSKGKTYYTIGVKLKHHIGEQPSVLLEGYIDGHHYESGRTIEEVCENLSNNPKQKLEPLITDVAIDVAV